MVDLPRVVIAAATFKRPESLAELLDGIAALDVQADVSVVICDNDAEGAAGQAVVKRYAATGTYPFPLEAIVAEQRGISHARNGLFAHVSENYDCDYIAIIDDDETPCKTWLADLLAVAKDTNADVIGGPVLSVFADPDVSTAIKECEQFERVSKPSGPVNVILSTENVMVRRAALDMVAAPWFDPAFAITGGSDADFFYRLKFAGATFAWADGAEVSELVPETRSNTGWVIKRNYRRGCNTAWRALRRPNKLKSIPRILVLGVGGIVTFPLFWLSGWNNPTKQLNARLRLWRAYGYFSGFAQFQVQDYKEVHGK
jgi:GT2 family glycosyltransferase